MAGALRTGGVIVFFAYVTNLYSPMKALSKLSYALGKAAVGAERIAEVMHQRSEVVDRENANAAGAFQGLIEFRNLAFEYEEGQSILSEINLTIAPGQTVAIVGATGAGKSTLVSLVPRFYDPTRGVVMLDGKDIRNFRVQSLREQMSLVLQDALLFRGTVRENIAFGRPNATDEEIVAAAAQANADEFIQRLPQGYDTPIAERGATLSGGQKQRIAIARAILRNAPILILDEPTSGLDAESERLVIEALEHAASKRTTLVIAHRLASIRFADRIVVMERGRIVEEGTHRSLLARNGKDAHFPALPAGSLPAPHGHYDDSGADAACAATSSGSGPITPAWLCCDHGNRGRSERRSHPGRRAPLDQPGKWPVEQDRLRQFWTFCIRGCAPRTLSCARESGRHAEHGGGCGCLPSRRGHYAANESDGGGGGAGQRRRFGPGGSGPEFQRRRSQRRALARFAHRQPKHRTTADQLRGSRCRRHGRDLAGGRWHGSRPD